MSGPVVAAHRAKGEGRAVSVLWLVAGVLAASQMLATIQISALRDRVVQIEAGVEFWEYGLGGCAAPPDGGSAGRRGGATAAALPEGAV